MFLNFSFSNDAVGYIVDGVVDAKAIAYLESEILKKLEENEVINLYLEDADVKRISAKAVIVATLFPHRHKNRFQKVAMVTNRRWIHFICWVNNFFVDATIKNFLSNDRLKAIEWISK